MPLSGLTRSFLTYVLLMCFLTQKAQVLLPAPESAFEPQHNFNRVFVKSRNIKRIVFDIIDKKDFEAPVDRSLTETYEFDAEGRVTRYYYTVISRTVERQITTETRKGRKVVRSHRTVKDYVFDTISTNYYYDKERLVLRRQHDGRDYFEARYYRYDSEGRVTRELRYRETNASADPSSFILGNQVLLSADSFQYTKYSSGQLRQILLNSENRPYKERIINYDSAGRKTNVSEQYTAASWITQNQEFKYAGNRLATARFTGNAGSKLDLLHVFEYDSLGELYSEKQFKNETLVKEISYVTDRAGKLLNSFVIRDHINKTMRIIKLRYDLGLVMKNGGKQL